LERFVNFFRNLTKKQIIIIVSVIAGLVVAAVLVVFVLPIWTISGIDVSHYEDNISWTAVAQSGNIKFVYIKATEGTTNQDPTFKANWDGAVKNGIIPGAYHYFTSTSAADTQAQNFINTVPKVAGMLPPAVDIEGTLVKNANFKQELAVFVQAITQHYGVKPILYVPYSVYNAIFDDYTGYNFWIIDDQTQPLIKNWTFRQYSQPVNMAGVSEKVDIDEYHGTFWGFEQLKLQ
jgi:Lyzozyme M1 (1,4-beta-N-acetylmuramidase)